MSSSSKANVFGMQGGGWTEHTGDVRKTLIELAALREAGKKAGTWPDASITDKRRPSDGDEGYTWAGAARMARARRDAGVPLTDIDHEALARAEA